MILPSTLDTLLCDLPELSAHHVPTSKVYGELKVVARRLVEELFSESEASARPFGPFGHIEFPYYRMGAIDSLDLFGLDELIIFSFYWANRRRYRKVADLGANIGLHSIVLERCGYEVRCYEPDPEIFQVLSLNLERNGTERVTAINSAVSDSEGNAEFVRVIGNRTGSHLAGAKENPYGELERFPVRIEALAPITRWADLLKIDVEGHEAELVRGSDEATWQGTDAIMEVGSPENAKIIFTHLNGLDVTMFSQKIGWARVRSLSDMPTSYRDGSLFVTTTPEMRWG